MLTTVHTLICFVAIGLGIVAIGGINWRVAPEPWTGLFIVAAILATGTGFLVPFNGVTPAFGTGIVASVVLVVLIVARYGFGLAASRRSRSRRSSA